MQDRKAIAKFLKANHRNEQRKLWNHQLKEAGYEARYIVEAEGIWIESEANAEVATEEIAEAAPEEIAPEETATEEIANDELAIEIYEAVQKLDYDLGTENFLPIYHIRKHFKQYSRKDVDNALYTLMREDMVDVSTLQEASAYTPEQIDAGIAQAAGGALFFIEII